MKGSLFMGLIADFVVAAPEDALQYESLLERGNAVPPDRYQRAQYKNFTPLALGFLWAILRSEKWDVERHRLEDVSHTDETWLQRFPDELVNLISTCDEAAASTVTEAWAQHEEVPGNSDELRPVLVDLKHLAIQAQKRGQRLYLWVSL